jgi:hypothetical protein
MESNNDSLEMLLDTICNTFGAVLFIAMLIVLMVNPNAREGGGETEPSTSIDFAEVQAEIAEMQLEATRLERVLTQQEALTERFGDPNSKRLAAEIVKTKRQQASLVEDRATQARQLADSNEQNARLREQMRSQRAAFKQATKNAKLTNAKLRNVRAKTSRSAQTPKSVRLRTTPIVTMLKGGVWYCLLKPNVSGELKINPVDCTPKPLGQNLELRPRVGGGQNLRNVTGKVTMPTAGNPSRNHYTVYLHADSTDEYQAVKNAISSSGYKLRLVLIAKDSEIIFGRGVSSSDAWGQ